MTAPPAGRARRRLSVQQLSLAAIALLVLSTSIAVSGLVWSSRLLERTSNELVRAGEGLRIARDLEQALFSHQRLAILDEPRGEDVLAAEQTFARNMAAARALALSEAQANLLDALEAQASAYFALQASSFTGEAAAGEVLVTVRPAFNDAVDIARTFAQHNERELARGNETALRLGSVFRIAAVIAASLALVLAVLIGFAVRRMILKPILGIREALVKFRSGDDAVQADENIAPELGEIAAAFNEMKEELARRRAERLAFLGGVAHDLRNPIAALKASVETLELSDPSAVRGGQTLRILSRQLVQLDRMCGDLLELSKMEAGVIELDMRAVDLRDAALSVIELYRPTAGAREIELDLDPEPVVATADRLRIEQVIGNLVKNAIKYSDEGSNVSIAVKRHADAAEIVVADEGFGIPEQDLGTIFEPFRQGSVTAQSGAGLGLSVVRRIVDAHGGSISVESRPGTGSTFRVRLPPASGASTLH